MFLSGSTPIGGANDAWSPFPFEFSFLLVPAIITVFFPKKLHSRSLSDSYDTYEGWPRKLSEDHRRELSDICLIILCFDKLEEVKCDLCMDIPKRKMKKKKQRKRGIK